jgi:FHA domain/Domain of unknown function (DUF4388)
MEMILEGSLVGFGVPDLLSLLNVGRRTGVLVLERADRESKLFLEQGRPVFATSSADDLRFGNVLVRQGAVKADVVDRLLRQRGGRMGQLLLSEKILSETQLASLLKVQVSEVIFDSFDWKDGTFAFYDAVLPPIAAVTLDIDLLNLVLEGVRRRPPTLGAALDPALIADTIVNPERVKKSGTLTPEEWQIFFLVDGRRSVKEISRLAGGKDEKAALPILKRLVEARFIALSGPGGPPAPPSPTTQRVPEAKPESRPPPKAPAAPPRVAFAPPMVASPSADDTGEIVSKQAVRYLEEATRLTVSRLILVVADKGEVSYPLTRDSYTVGRHKNNDIVIADPKVSSFHARIDRVPEGFALVDLKSRNGCWVNGKRAQTMVLRTGDEIRTGAARLLYKVDYTSAV